MNFFKFLRCQPTPPTPPPSRLRLALEKLERAKAEWTQADVELFAAAIKAFPQGRLVFAGYKGYGIIIGKQFDITYHIDVHVMTFCRPPVIEKAQIHSVKVGDLRIVPWAEAGEQSGYLTWIRDHPLSEVIYKANRT